MNDTSFPPTSEEINALPPNLRRWVHDLQTEADPAGTIRHDALVTDENAALRKKVAEQEEEADFHFHLISRQDRLLTGVVNAIRGRPGPLESWSHHDAPELAKRAMAVVMAAASLDGAIAEFPEEPGAWSDYTQQLGDALTVFQRSIDRTSLLTDPGTPLPTWQDAFAKVEAGQELNPIEAFIVRLTPGDDERAKDFRRLLRAALDYTAQAVRS